MIVTEGPEKSTVLDKAEVKEIRASKISLMPDGYKALGERKLRDIVTFFNCGEEWEVIADFGLWIAGT